MDNGMEMEWIMEQIMERIKFQLIVANQCNENRKLICLFHLKHCQQGDRKRIEMTRRSTRLEIPPAEKNKKLQWQQQPTISLQAVTKV